MSLIDNLIDQGYLKTPEIIEAFKMIKREDFLLPEDKSKSDINLPLSIGFGQTNSQPATVAFMLEKLQAKKGEKVLDVGSGSGWTTALLAQIVGPTGLVFGLERINELAQFSINNINKYNFIKKGVVHIICTDGYLGLPEQKPFDKIIASAASKEIPKAFKDQLKCGGRLIMPVRNKYVGQSLIVADKIDDKNFKIKEHQGFIFVPLIKNQE